MRRVASIGIGAASAAFINAARGPASVSASSASINAARGQHRHRCGIADNRSGCIRRQQVWMCSPATGLDVFADHRSGCIRRRQVWMYSPTAGHAATAAPGAGRRGRQGPNPRERRIEVTRARDPLPGPRHTSPPLTLVCVDARRPPRLTPRVTRGHMQGSTGAPGAYPRARARNVEITRARYPFPGPRRTSPPFTIVRAGARGSPRFTGAARNARAQAGQP